ncbi:MAG: GtrA family protein [Gammaproteobacteria bacterium]
MPLRADIGMLRAMRFAAAGVWNTGVSYGVYALAIFLGAPYYVAVFAANVAGAANNYLTFSIFVFGDRPKSGAARYLAGFALVYFFGVAAIGFCVDILGINPYLGGFLPLPFVVAFSFAVNNWFVFREARR